MKKIFAIIAAIIITLCSIAQVPQKMCYQAVIRNSTNQLVTNHAVGMQISILQGSTSGTIVYSEIQTPTTNANGLVSIEIGDGTSVTGTFTGIDWSTGTYFIKSETDPAGGTDYTITGTSQLLSVPYAIYSKKAGTADYNNLTSLPNLSSYLTIESDPVFRASPANVISNTDVINWNTAYAWSNHAGLYRLVSWVPAWTDVTGKPSFAAVASSGSYNDLINNPTLFSGSYNDLSNKPVLFDGNWTSLTGKPVTLSGFGITDAMSTSHSANAITSTNITNWNSAYGWGNHASVGYSILPSQISNNGKYLTTNGTNTSWNGLSTVAISGSYNDLLNKPVQLTESDVESYIANDVATGYIPRDNGTKLVSGSIYDNGTKVGIGTTNPSAALDVTSNSQGFVMPRMTTTQRIGIIAPIEGLQVYDTDLKGFYYFNGTRWDCSSVPAGTIIYYGGNTPPVGYLACDGSQVLRTKYPELFAAIGITYGPGNGSTGFNVPDLRGWFIRGWDQSRIIGSQQSDQIQSHTHSDAGHSHTDAGHTHSENSVGYSSVNRLTGAFSTVGTVNNISVASGTGYSNISTNTAILGNPVISSAGPPRYGDETRPKNVALMICIKY